MSQHHVNLHMRLAAGEVLQLPPTRRRRLGELVLVAAIAAAAIATGVVISLALVFTFGA